jgi:hypothetical protein
LNQHFLQDSLWFYNVLLRNFDIFKNNFSNCSYENINSLLLILIKFANVVLKGFLTDASSNTNRFPKASGVENFAEFAYCTLLAAAFRNPLLVALEVLLNQ